MVLPLLPSLYMFIVLVTAANASASAYKIRVPRTKHEGARVLDPHVGSLSIESCYITDYFGKAGEKNELSWNLLTNFYGVFGGLRPYIRLGGHTQDHASFDPNQKEALRNVFAQGNDEAVNVTYGSTLFSDVFLKNIAPSSMLILGLNFRTLNISIALEVARAAWHAFLSQGQQSRLRMTVGNEPDQWGWAAEDYSQHMAEFLQTLQSEISLPKNWFQVGDLANPPDPSVIGQNYTNKFLLRRLLQLGLGDTGDIWTMSQHTYPFSVCSEQTAANATLANLLNYTHLTYHMSMFVPDIASVNEAGYDYVLGETGSVSCHGKQGVSDTFGTALYMINFMLHGASIGIKRSFFHNGTPFWYSLWRPTISNSGDKTVVNPTYSSFLFVSQILGTDGREKAIVELEGLRRHDLSAFAIFDIDSNSTLPKTFVLVDSQIWFPPSRRPARTIDLSAVISDLPDGGISVKRLTSSRGVKARVTDFSLAGVRVDNTGRLVGSLEVEKGYRTGLVTLNAAEAVIIDIH